MARTSLKKGKKLGGGAKEATKNIFNKMKEEKQNTKFKFKNLVIIILNFCFLAICYGNL